MRGLWTLRCSRDRATTRSNSISLATTRAMSRSIRNSRNTSALSGPRLSQSGARTTRSFCRRAPRPSSATTRTRKSTSWTPVTLPSKAGAPRSQRSSATSLRASCANKLARRNGALTPIDQQEQHIMSKVILITGASTGFGRDTAETLASKGHKVFAAMRDPQKKNRAHAEALGKIGIRVVELDVSDDASVDKAVDEVLSRADRIDVLINNAGIASAGVTEAFTPDQAKVVFNTNVVGILRTTRAVLPAMRKQRDGLIINIGSILGRVTFPFFGIYGASKFAVEALTECYRYELSQLGIDVALIQPSAYPTPMYSSVQLPADTDRVSAYGSIGEVPSAMFKHFMETFQAADAPDPHDVAAAIATLVAQPKRSRPARTVVGAAFGSDTLNAQTA